MSRINIVCSEKDKESLLKVFESYCPFDPYPENCGEDERCGECIEKHITFDITE